MIKQGIKGREGERGKGGSDRVSTEEGDGQCKIPSHVAPGHDKAGEDEVEADEILADSLEHDACVSPEPLALPHVGKPQRLDGMS